MPKSEAFNRRRVRRQLVPAAESQQAEPEVAAVPEPAGVPRRAREGPQPAGASVTGHAALRPRAQGDYPQRRRQCMREGPPAPACSASVTGHPRPPR